MSPQRLHISLYCLKYYCFCCSVILYTSVFSHYLGHSIVAGVNSHHVLLCCGHRKARRLLTRSQLRRACRQPCEQINLRRVPQGPVQGPILAPPHPSLRMRGPIVIHDWPSSVLFHLPASSLSLWFLPLVIQHSGQTRLLRSLWKYRNGAFSEA